MAPTSAQARQESTDNDETDNGRKPGRPRSNRSRKAILAATRRLLTQTSINDLSIEAIAKKAQVGKTTVYRWWSNKAAVALDAFLEQPGIQNVIPTTSTAEEAVRRQLENMIRELRGQNGYILAGIIAESQSDPDVLEMLYEKFLKERVEFLAEKYEEGQEAGEFKAEIDPDIALDIMLGPLFLRILSGPHGIDDNFAATYVYQVILALKA